MAITMPAPVVQTQASTPKPISAPVREEPQVVAPSPPAVEQPDTGVAAPAITLAPLTDPAATPVVAAESVPAAHAGHAPGDPLEGFNRVMFAIHQRVDRAVFRPVALGYRHTVPRPVRSGLRNFFHNLGEPLVFLNDLLQLKPGRAARTMTRFLINSTIGIGGLVDVAKQPNFGLPHHANGFGDTLGYYGVGPGPYIFLPLVGPTTLRDFIGGQGEGFVIPAAVGNPFDRWEYQMPKAVITGLDIRAESDDDFKALLESAVDPYATLRSVYLQDRAGEIEGLHSGRRRASSAANPLDDPLSDPAGAKTSPLDDPLTDPATAPAPTGDKGTTPTETSTPVPAHP
ncbi:MlaA family lipoprotein [Sphingomonas oligophenolica]|uniref:MlaA family lipoprotein n=1 Tax=Sphingomonas oligophenolica TaxID=301154 RepID=A0ABU9YAH8_9SPHN